MATMLFLLLTLLSQATFSLSQNCHPDDKSALLQIKKEFNNPTILSSWKPDSDCCQDNCQSTALSGPIPYFPPAQFKRLKWLSLSSNNLTGTLPPSLRLLPRLKGVFFDNNKLTGTIPPSYGKFWRVVVNNNQLSGTIPKSFSSIKLFEFQVANNSLQGDASMLFGSNKTANIIDISGNNFSFDFGKVEVSKNLATLDVSRNQIYGKLPVGIDNVLNLNVSYNLLCGEIPKLGNLQTFDVSTYFHNKCLCGSPLPSCR
ncbi:Leucine-rich repeat-containing N-terminal, plant-type [Sesbania bispinosa]|nr:Leucine-rich repeat-containing N-terminal, plant-type [Sesbania bispinosa]